ncbi:hypothetical protein D3C73_1246400 [compost metagenome]
MVPLIAIVVAFSWLATGYIRLEQGVLGIARQSWTKAEQSLQAAEALLPWSHEVHYQLAALYSRIGQSQGDEAYMNRAKAEIQTAATMIPENRHYQELLQQAEKQEK